MEYLYLIVLGCSAGVLSGALGIGGGLVIVPGLVQLYKHLGIFGDDYMPIAAGTSLAVMIFTASGNTLFFQRQRRIDWRLFRDMVPWIVVFNVLGAFLASSMPAKTLEIVFGSVILLMAAKMILDLLRSLRAGKAARGQRKIPTFAKAVAGMLIGLKSGLLGIGGGAIATPFFANYGVPIRIATGTTASLTLPIGIVGTAAFVIIGIHTGHDYNESLGYVHWTSVVILAPFTVVTTFLGTKLSDWMPTVWLRGLFIVFLLFAGLKSLLQILPADRLPAFMTF